MHFARSLTYSLYTLWSHTFIGRLGQNVFGLANSRIRSASAAPDICIRSAICQLLFVFICIPQLTAADPWEVLSLLPRLTHLMCHSRNCVPGGWVFSPVIRGIARITSGLNFYWFHPANTQKQHTLHIHVLRRLLRKAHDYASTWPEDHRGSRFSFSPDWFVREAAFADWGHTEIE